MHTRLRFLPPIIMLLASMMIAACTLRPIYASGKVEKRLRQIELGPILDKSGYLLRTNLAQSMALNGPEKKKYRLDITLEDQIIGFGIQGNDSISRERRVLKATYRLARLADGKLCVSRTISSDTGINVVSSSNFATVAAESSALENLTAYLAQEITNRLALYLQKNPDCHQEK